MGRPINQQEEHTMYIKKPFVPLLKLDIQFFAENKKDEAVDLKTLQTEFNASWKSLKGLLDQQADEMRTHGETAQSTADSITAIEQKINQYEQELKGVTDKYKDFETKMQRPSFGGGERAKSAGDLLIESDSYKNMGSGEFKASTSLKGFFTKDLDSTDPKGGILVSPQTIAGVLTPPQEDLRIRDLLNVQRTTSNAIEYIVETGFTNASAVAPEKSLKPQSDLTFDIESATVKTLAHWIPATRQIIQDAPMLRNYVDGRLTYGLALTEEAQILYGDGVGDNMAGIMTNPNVQNVGGVAAADTRIDHLRRAITRTLLAGYPATGIVLHPSDWEDIELQKGTDGHYIWVSVVNGGETRLWRVPVVQSTGMNEGEFLVGAFGLAGQLWDREQANVRISEHHADYFARNMLAILAEERLALTVYRPEAFVRGAFTAAV
jgi:HK97 family phage major capsid protein